MEHLGRFVDIPHAMPEGPSLVSVLISEGISFSLPASEFLDELDEASVVWHAPWVATDALLCTRDSGCLTLLGLYGYSSYMPQCFLRQFRILQDIPYVYGELHPFTTYTSSFMARSPTIVHEWVTCFLAFELGLKPLILVEVTVDYRAWFFQLLCRQPSRVP